MVILEDENGIQLYRGTSSLLPSASRILHSSSQHRPNPNKFKLLEIVRNWSTTKVKEGTKATSKASTFI